MIEIEISPRRPVKHGDNPVRRRPVLLFVPFAVPFLHVHGRAEGLLGLLSTGLLPRLVIGEPSSRFRQPRYTGVRSSW